MIQVTEKALEALRSYLKASEGSETAVRIFLQHA